jgi:hypothetical protein
MPNNDIERIENNKAYISYGDPNVFDRTNNTEFE